MNLERAYRTFRSPRIFLWVLCIFCAAWVAWNMVPALPHFDDPGFARLTLILSVEASVASAVMLAVQERQEKANARQLRYMLDLMEAVVAMAKGGRNVGDVAPADPAGPRSGVAEDSQ